MTNTLLGRTYIFEDKDEITPAVRNTATSTARAVTVRGCRKAGRITSTETPGVLATYGLLCSCEACRRNDPASCCLIRKGIAPAPAEFSRIRSVADETCPRDAALQEMFQRLQGTLGFGSFSLLRVRPEENVGQELVPIAVGRKAPCEWSADYARDGMFDHGDVMVFIHEFKQDVFGAFDVPKILSDEEMRAVPLKCLAAPGRDSLGYMDPVLGPTRVDAPLTKYRRRPGVVEEGRENLVRMSLDPASAFTNVARIPLQVSDKRRARIQPSLFPKGTKICRGFGAPAWGNGRAWSGLERLTATVIDIATFLQERRHYYRLEWTGDIRTLILANAPMDVDEGYIEKYVVSAR